MSFLTLFLPGQFYLVKRCSSCTGFSKMMRRTVLILLSASFPLISQAHDDCGNNADGAQRGKCAEAEMKFADEKLNASYKALIDRANARYIFQYQSQPELNKAFLDRLKASQKSWLKLRDTNCRLEGLEDEWDKDAHTAGLNKCLTSSSLERVKYLDALIPQR